MIPSWASIIIKAKLQYFSFTIHTIEEGRDGPDVASGKTRNNQSSGFADREEQVEQVTLHLSILHNISESSKENSSAVTSNTNSHQGARLISH